MKIGLNARFLAHPFTGIGQYTHYLIRSLAKIDKRNEYFLFTPQVVNLELPDSFHQIRVAESDSSSASLRKAHWEHTLIPAEMEKWKVNVAHFLYPANPWRRMGMPTVVTVHDMIPWRLPIYQERWRSKFYFFYARQALKKADHLITVSEFSKREIMEVMKVKEKNIAVIPHGLPLASPDPTLPDLPLRRPFLLYVGGYDPRKNIPSLIRAYLKHIANTHAIDLILVGGKGHGLEALLTGEYCEKVAGDIPVQPKGDIIFTNPLSANELEALYRQAVMLVHPSFYEGFNLPLVEAMSHGLPMVVSDIPVNREVTGGHALFFDPRSIDSIGNAIHQLLNDPLSKKSFSAQGLEKSKQYSWQKSAQATLDVYNLFS